jgi:hypothetical protein
MLGQQTGGIACHHGRGLPGSGLHRADQTRELQGDLTGAQESAEGILGHAVGKANSMVLGFSRLISRVMEWGR